MQSEFHTPETRKAMNDAMPNFRAIWARGDRLEKPTREKWNNLEGWRPVTPATIPTTSILVRDKDELPHIAYRDSYGWWACVSGDVWPMKLTDTMEYCMIPDESSGTEANDHDHPAGQKPQSKN